MKKDAPELLGYFCEYYNRKREEEPITRTDMNSNDKERQDWFKSYIIGLMEPWSPSAESFDVRLNVRYDGIKVAKNELWKATYTSIPYDTIECELIAYGATASEAVANAEKLLEELKKVYEERYEKDDNDG